MNPHKLDPSLSMLLSMTPEQLARAAGERRLALRLEGDDAWVDVTIRSTGDLASSDDIRVTDRLASVTTANVRLRVLDSLSERPTVIYISPVRGGRPLLHRTRSEIGVAFTDGLRIRGGADLWDGRGVVVGVIDSGFDLAHPAFRQFPGGPTRVEWYWDRTVVPRPGDPPHPSGVGVLYSRANIDVHLLGPAATPPVLHPGTLDLLGHGSHVAGIAAGAGSLYRGVAAGARLILVRLLDTDIGVLHNLCDWIFRQAGGPCAINISQGNTAGPHDGTSDVETGLDALLRDPATLAARSGRFIAVAAGNDRLERWHVRTRVLPAGRPRTQLVWVSPDNNAAADEVVLWYSGVDQIRIRLIAPVAVGSPARITHWVAPHAAGSIEVAHADPGNFAPTVAGPGASKTFNFTGGSRAVVAHGENALNGDRQILLRLEPPVAAPANIAAGFWLIELEGIGNLPGGGRVDGFVNMDAAPDQAPNMRLFRPALTARSLRVAPARGPGAGRVTHLDVHAPVGVQRAFRVLIDYPADEALEVQARPGALAIHGTVGPPDPPTQWVGTGPAVGADPGLTAPAGPVAPGAAATFAFGNIGSIIRINHVAAGNRQLITLEVQGPPPLPQPDAGVYRVSLRSVSPGGPAHGSGRTLEAHARIDQDHTADGELCVFYDEPFSTSEIEVYPDTCRESVSRLSVGAAAPFQTRFDITVPGGAWAEVRVLIPPTDRRQDNGGWAVTPFVGARPAPLVHVVGTVQVTTTYAAPAVGADGHITLLIEETGGGQIHEGEWKLEFRGVGLAAPRELRSELVHMVDGGETDEFEAQLAPGLNHQRLSFQEVDGGVVSVAFEVVRSTSDEVRLELIYDANNDVRVRLHPPPPTRLGFSVGPGDAVTVDPGVPAVPVGPPGAAAPLPGGSVVTISHPAAPNFPGHRRVLVTLSSPDPVTPAYHPLGLWRLDIEPIRLGGSHVMTARLSGDGHTPYFLRAEPPTSDHEQGALRTPSTSREVLGVANSVPGLGPFTLPNVSSSPGPVRRATLMRPAGPERRWLSYAKPEISAPGTGIAAPCSAATALWLQTGEPAQWRDVALPDGRALLMRATWPLLENGPRLRAQNVAPSVGGAAAVEVTWPFVVPQDAEEQARLVVRFPAGRMFGLRVEQPTGAGAPANPRRTNAVFPGPARLPAVEVPTAGAGVAPGTVLPPNPDGTGFRYQMGDETRIYIRQNGRGRAVVDIRRRQLAAGQWRLILRHTEAFAGGPVPVTVETEPVGDSLGWPKFAPGEPPRLTLPVAAATGAGAPGAVVVPVTIPERMAGDVMVRLTYPGPPAGPGGTNLRVAVLNPGPSERTRSVDNTGTRVTEPALAAALAGLPGPTPPEILGTNLAAGPGLAAGGRFVIGPTDNVVTIRHAPGVVTVTFSRGTSAQQRIADGRWSIVVLNHDAGVPAPFDVTFDLEPGPHDAVFFRVETGPAPFMFHRVARLAVPGPAAEWRVHVPDGRRHEIAAELLYDPRDTLEVQVQTPGIPGDRTEPVGFGNAAVGGGLGATLPNTGVVAAAGGRPAGIGFQAAGRFRAVVSNLAHPDPAVTRRRALVSLRVDGDEPIPPGDWIIRINPTAVGGGSNGVVEGWIEENQYFLQTGTSMASPHVAGLAALLLQQDVTQTHEDIKRRLLSTVRPLVITRGGDVQLPNQWDPAAGFGFVDGAAALLGHTGGRLHNQGAAPAARDQTTGCPVVCEDNCLLEGVRAAAVLTGLRISPRAPYNHSPRAQGADPLPECPRLAAYVRDYLGDGFNGGGNFLVGPHVRLALPLVRDRAQRGALDGFRLVSWEEAYRTLAERLVEQWSNTGGIVVMEPSPDAGLVRELVFNRFVHHLHRLLGASNVVKKCSFTTKKKVTVLASRVPFGSPRALAAHHGLTEFMDGHAPSFHGRSELAMADAVIVWGANLPANARALWRTIAAARDRRGDTLEVFVVDPGLPDLPDVPAFARRISIAPGSDRHLALALMLRMVGNPGHALPLRQVPPDPRFDDAARGLTRFLSTQGANLADFVSHVRGVAATYLQVVAGVVTPDAALADLCLLPGATADDRARFTTDVRALFEACLGGAAAFVLGSGPSRFVDGEEHVQYLAALAFLSGNVGAAGAGLSFGEDRHPTFNTAAFAAAHDTRRPGENPELGAVADQETLNAASLAADAPDTTKVLLWFDLDPLTHLPDPAAMESLLQRSQLNVQISHGLDDASRFADVLLPLGDSLRSFDLQVGTRSPWINLTQPLLPREDPGPRPMARILHELLEAVRAQLVEDDFDDDLEPVFEEAVYRTGALLLPRARRAFFAAFFEDAPRIPNLLTDRLPVDEAANIRAHLKDWYASVRGGEPATDTDDGVTFNNAPRFFDRMQVDWMLEALFARHTEREVVLLLYNLLQRGTVLDPRRFGGDSFGVLPDGGTPLARFVVNGTRHADLKGAAGFAPERAAYRDAVAAVEAGATGRAAFPMRLVIAQSPSFASTHIPLAEQVAGGAVLPPVAVLNPASPSVRAFPGGLAAGAAVALVGNVTYRPGETFETVIARATVQFDPTMALETIRMTPGWHGLDRGGQRLARGVHSEEGEVPALFDNLVRLAPAGYVPAGNAAGRGASPPKR